MAKQVPQNLRDIFQKPITLTGNPIQKIPTEYPIVDEIEKEMKSAFLQIFRESFVVPFKEILEKKKNG